MRKMARGKINFAWEWHKFIQHVSKNMHQSSISAPRGANWPRGVSLFAPSGSLGELPGASEDRRRRRLTWISPSPHPITPRKTNAVRLGSSLRLGYWATRQPTRAYRGRGGRICGTSKPPNHKISCFKHPPEFSKARFMRIIY